MREIKELRLNALSGYFDGERVEQWAPVRSILLIFISSTFTDTQFERNILKEKILPDLRNEGKRRYNIDVTIVDMRWGVRDENTCSQMTWEYCYREIDRCCKRSSGLFMLSLQSDKYGYRPLPRVIDKHVFENSRTDSI